jgi:ubiquinone/menaquinone biosynthesis C-methylase UbiE
MDHADHVGLIRAGVDDRPGTWADLGSGTGAFTLALADVLGGRGSIVSVDRDARALSEQRERMAAKFPSTDVRYEEADFTRALEVGALDGILMANSLHFVRDKEPVLLRLLGNLRRGGRFILVEYDADHGNPWVPHPISFETWRGIADEVGLVGTRLGGRVPSRFLGAVYSAISEAHATWTTQPMNARVDLGDKEAVRRALNDS